MCHVDHLCYVRYGIRHLTFYCGLVMIGSNSAESVERLILKPFEFVSVCSTTPLKRWNTPSGEFSWLRFESPDLVVWTCGVQRLSDWVKHCTILEGMEAQKQSLTRWTSVENCWRRYTLAVNCCVWLYCTSTVEIGNVYSSCTMWSMLKASLWRIAWLSEAYQIMIIRKARSRLSERHGSLQLMV